MTVEGAAGREAGIAQKLQVGFVMCSRESRQATRVLPHGAWLRGSACVPAVVCLAIASGCDTEPLRPALAAPHVLNGTWIGASVDYSVEITLQVKDSVRIQPQGQIKTKYVSGVGKYGNLRTGAESTFTVPSYDVGLQSQLEPMTLVLWSSASQTFRFRGRLLDVNTIPGWLVRDQQPTSGPLVVDSAALTLNRDR